MKKSSEHLQREIVCYPIGDLIPYAKNSRTHSTKQIAQIVESIKEFGFTNPILVDEKLEIIAGHGRVLAAKKMELNHVPCIVLNHLTEKQKKAYVIADNKLALNAGWDDGLLAEELKDLDDMDFDLNLLGFDEKELDELLGETDKEGLTDEDDIPTLKKKTNSKLGDIYKLGNHRLMCGDSTDAGSVALLVNDKKIDMVFTDPPYNIDYEGVKDKGRKIKNDKMSDEDFVQFLKDSIMPCDTMYVCCSWQYDHLFKRAMEEISKKPKAMIVWNKVNPAQHLDKYFKQHEIIFYYGAFGGQRTVRGDVWELKRQRNTIHPTMKPVELIEMALNDHKSKKTVYDSFGGSGSTLIACEKTDRNCYMMELDPHYIDVIIKRWEEYTGEKAIKVNG